MAFASGDAARFNRDFYDKFWGECSDFVRYNPGARHRRRITARFLDGLAGDSLLDVGCGTSELLAWLRYRLPAIQHFAGADLSAESVKRNQERFPDLGYHVLNVEQEALDATFDIVVCSEVIEHLDDRAAAFKNLAAMVAPGGHLLVTAPTGKLYATELHFGHVTHPDLAELEAHGEANGLTLRRAENWGWPLYKTLKWATNINAEWSLRNFASNAYSAWNRWVSSSLYWANFVNLPSSRRGCQLFVLFSRPEIDEQ